MIYDVLRTNLHNKICQRGIDKVVSSITSHLTYFSGNLFEKEPRLFVKFNNTDKQANSDSYTPSSQYT